MTETFPSDSSGWARLRQAEGNMELLVAATSLLTGHLVRGSTHNAAESIMSAHRMLLERGGHDLADSWLNTTLLEEACALLAKHDFFSRWLRQWEPRRHPSERRFDAESVARDDGSRTWLGEVVSDGYYVQRYRTAIPLPWRTFCERPSASDGSRTLLALSDSRSRDLEQRLRYPASAFSVVAAWEDPDARSEDIVFAVHDGRITIVSVTLSGGG